MWFVDWVNAGSDLKDMNIFGDAPEKKKGARLGRLFLY
jgi:hypothetical protein